MVSASASRFKLYIKTQGDIGGTVNDTNSNVLINFTVAELNSANHPYLCKGL
jgi:hypothetical protein